MIGPLLSERDRHRAYDRLLEEAKNEMLHKGMAFVEGYMQGVGPVRRFLYDADLLRSPIEYDAAKSLLEEKAAQETVSIGDLVREPAN